MACPICKKVLCDHTPEERGQTLGQMMADCYFGLQDGEELSEGEATKKATDCLRSYPDDGWKTVVSLIGEAKATKLKASLQKP